MDLGGRRREFPFRNPQDDPHLYPKLPDGQYYGIDGEIHVRPKIPYDLMMPPPALVRPNVPYDLMPALPKKDNGDKKENVSKPKEEPKPKQKELWAEIIRPLLANMTHAERMQFLAFVCAEATKD